MALQSITNISVDFCDKKYILINAKQLDKNSRFVSVTCYNQGESYPLNSGEHSAYVRYKKADNHSVFNHCEIGYKGNVLVELTEQMLASDGICYADLIIVNKGDAEVDVDTGEITGIDNASVLSTMTFCIDVSETAVENSEIESSYEFSGLNDLLERAEADYEEVVQTAKSWAVGGTGIRTGEDTDNAKYYYKKALTSANNSAASASSAASSASSAKEYMDNALLSEQNAETYMTNAKTYMKEANASAANAYTSETNAKTSETNAATSASNAKTSASNAATSASNAKTSETNAATSESNAKTSETNAATSETNALNSANLSKSYAVGATGTRDGEDEDNSKYYYGLVKTVVENINNSFIPMGTITFSELETAEKATGYVYNISDEFTTDDTFREGSGKTYAAGTNVYYTASGEWDCFGGETIVVGVKGDNEESYRRGNINLTPENIGAVATVDVATVDEVKSYLGIE